MNAPEPPGTAIDSRRMRGWAADFAGYRVAVTDGRIDRWLDQFREDDRDLGARLLDAVDFIGNEQIAAAYRAVIPSIPGWNDQLEDRRGRWFFVPFSGSAGESGDVMTHRLRTALNLSGRQHDELFRYRSQLLEMAPESEDTVVLVDDFAGTGSQAVSAWNAIFRELLPYQPNIYLILVAATNVAVERIRIETDMVPLVHVYLTEADNIFSDECRMFSVEDKALVLRYCAIADPINIRGFGDSGLLVVLAHKCPNNSIPVLHSRRTEWEGLFRRYD